MTLSDGPDMSDCRLPETDPSDVVPDNMALILAFTSALIAECDPPLPPLEPPNDPKFDDPPL